MFIWIAFGLLAFTAFSLWIVPIYAVHQMTRMKRSTYKNCFDLLEENHIYSKQKFDTLDKEDLYIKSNDGLKLHGSFIEKYPHSNRIAIIIHGYTAALAWSSQFVDMFLKQGFNVLLVDQRAHGQSEGIYATFGYKEKYDIQAWVDWVVNRKGQDCIIALHGQSLGGGTVLEYAAIHRPQVRLIVADCPYSDLPELMEHQISRLNYFPKWPFMSLINRRLKKRAGFSMEDVSPIRVMKNCKLPILFIHGGADRFVPTYMSIDLYEAKPEPKQLLIIEDATHAVAYCKDRNRYEAGVVQFVEQVIGKPSPLELQTELEANEPLLTPSSLLFAEETQESSVGDQVFA